MLANNLCNNINLTISMYSLNEHKDKMKDK
jgi:hypothetical protein